MLKVRRKCRTCIRQETIKRQAKGRYFVQPKNPERWLCYVLKLIGNTELSSKIIFTSFFQRTNCSFIYVKKSNSLFICRYNRYSNEVSVDILTNWSDSTTIDFKEIKECVWSMKQDVLDLLIG